MFIYKHTHHIMNFEVLPESSVIKKYICIPPDSALMASTSITTMRDTTLQLIWIENGWNIARNNILSYYWQYKKYGISKFSMHSFLCNYHICDTFTVLSFYVGTFLSHITYEYTDHCVMKAAVSAESYVIYSSFFIILSLLRCLRAVAR